MKKLIALFAASVLLISLSSCIEVKEDKETRPLGTGTIAGTETEPCCK